MPSQEARMPEIMQPGASLVATIVWTWNVWLIRGHALNFTERKVVVLKPNTHMTAWAEALFHEPYC
jgi:hypothetical protein